MIVVGWRGWRSCGGRGQGRWLSVEAVRVGGWRRAWCGVVCAVPSRRCRGDGGLGGGGGLPDVGARLAGAGRGRRWWWACGEVGVASAIVCEAAVGRAGRCDLRARLAVVVVKRGGR